MVLAATVVAFLSAVADADLQAAEEAWRMAQYEDVLPRISMALMRPLSAADRTRAFELQAMTQAAFDKAPAAVEAFRYVLGTSPDYVLPKDASPKLAGFLEAARKQGPLGATAVEPVKTLTAAPAPTAPVEHSAEVATLPWYQSGWLWGGVAVVVAAAVGVPVAIAIARPGAPSGNLGKEGLR